MTRSEGLFMRCPNPGDTVLLHQLEDVVVVLRQPVEVLSDDDQVQKRRSNVKQTEFMDEGV
jgi:hypothetical protein